MNIHVDVHSESRSNDIESESSERILNGIGVAPGIVVGKAYLYARAAFNVEQMRLEPEGIEDEIKRFEWAVSRCERDLKKISAIARDKLGEESAEIFEAQGLMLRDEALFSAVIEHIRLEHSNADYSVMHIMSQHRQRMEASESEYLRERAHDLQDVEDRIITHLRRGKLLSAIEPQSIVVSENLTAADLLLFSRREILGCALDHGGATSHVSIMARALGIPAVVSLHGLTEQVQTGEMIILDGQAGKVIVNPPKSTQADYERQELRRSRRRAEQRHLASLPAETLDNHRVGLHANIEFVEELDSLREHGAEGIGLMRTEVLLLMKGEGAISEEQQFRVYRQIVEKTAPLPTTFRLLDLGGDKMLPVAHREHNPFLGWRGIRVLLDKTDLLVPQLRALLRASADGPIQLLVPMVTNLAEIDHFKRILNSVKSDLQHEGRAFADHIPIGIMVEVPAVALLADRYAEEVDFFSLGTNDLTQYTLAVDRGNDLVSNLYRTLHPGVLTLIKNTIDAGKRHNIPVSLCGEMGGDAWETPILVGLGLESISASPSYLPEVKRIVRSIRFEDAQALANQALTMTSAEEVGSLLDAWHAEHALDLAT